jgi:hypothetical protein
MGGEDRSGVEGTLVACIVCGSRGVGVIGGLNLLCAGWLVVARGSGQMYVCRK